jgi:transposase
LFHHTVNPLLSGVNEMVWAAKKVEITTPLGQTSATGMNLDNAQKQQVTAWIGEGLKLSEIQKRLETDFGVRLTYLEVRLLLDDLKLVPKNQEPAKSEKELSRKTVSARETAAPAGKPSQQPAPATGKVSVSVDRLARPGALVSGSVTFSDGKSAAWYLDQTGRLGVMPAEPGYKPSADDVQSFQKELQNEMQKQGF